MASDLYIIAAGKGSRMNSAIPKALVPITDEPCLTTTLQQIGHKFENVFIVVNIFVRDQWEKYFKELGEKYFELWKNVWVLPIHSGLGDGHAVLHGLAAATGQYGNRSVSSDIVIVWGDVFFPQGEIIDELLSRDMRGSALLPAVREQNPYVTLLVDEKMRCTSADFSKYGENHQTGFHDQSVFRFNRDALFDSLQELHRAFWKGGRYITPGGELSMLYTFHQLYNSNLGRDAYVYETDYPTLSFNTPEEVAEIQKEIDTKWKHKFRSQS